MNEDQVIIDKIYGKRDRKRGLLKTYLWFVEEVGELAESIRKGEREAIEEEIADVYAWLLSICNILEIDVREVFRKKYNFICPRCKREICMCAEDGNLNSAKY